MPTALGANRDLARFWQESIANFTLYYDPNDYDPDDDEGKKFWPAYTEKDRKVMNIGRPGQLLKPNFELSVGEDIIDKEKCEFWRSAPYYAPEGKKDGIFAHANQAVQEQMEI